MDIDGGQVIAWESDQAESLFSQCPFQHTSGVWCAVQYCRGGQVNSLESPATRILDITEGMPPDANGKI